jgi:hypothetical protein
MCLLLVVLGLLSIFSQSSHAQQGPGQQSPDPTQQSPGTPVPPNGALQNPVLDEADERRVITYVESFAAFKYRHDALEGGVDTDGFEFDYQQAFGQNHRFAAGIQLPLTHADAPGATSANGLGDITLTFRGEISKDEKFEQAAGLELTVPSATNNVLGDGQTVLKMIWGFSAQLTRRTLFSGDFGYNKAVANQRAVPGVNSLEPELILSQQFARRFAGYLDWDNYYEFNLSEYVQTMQAGMEFELDRSDKWSLAPYVVFPLNHATRSVETKNGVGFDLIYNF